MDLEVQRGLLLALGSIPDEVRQREYARGLAVDLPAQAGEINGTVDCYVRTHDAGQCLSQVLGGQTISSLPQPSAELRDAARQVAQAGEEALAQGWNRMRYAAEFSRVYYGDFYQNRITSQERIALNNLVSFYARRLPDNTLETVRGGLRSRIYDGTARLSAYDTRPVLPVALPHPPLCSQGDWEYHMIAVRGLSYSIPVAVPRGLSMPFVLYENALYSEFEVLKTMIAPAEFERIIHPGNGVPDMVFFLGGGFPGSNQVLNVCGMRTDDRGGEFSGSSNHIMSNSAFDNNQWALSAANPIGVMGFAWSFKVLHHEMGHAIYARLLNQQQRDQFEDFFQAMRRGYGAETSDRRDYWVPNSEFVQSVNGVVHSRTYGLTNEREYFAEMFDEYLSYQLRGDQPIDPPVRARFALMRDFFRRDGVHPEAFSPEAVVAAFRAAGAPLDYRPRSIGGADLLLNGFYNSTTGAGAELYFGGRGVSGSRIFSYGGGAYLQGGFQGPGHLGFGFEGNVGLMPASWIGLDLLGRIGFRADFNSSSPTGVAGLGGRLRLRPSSVFEFQGFFIPQVDMSTGRTSYDVGGGIGFNFY